MKTKESRIMQSGKSPVGVVILWAVVVALVIIAAFVTRIVLYPAGQAVKVYEKTLDADNAIYNYEYFRQAYQDIKAMEFKIKTAQTKIDSFLSAAGPREKWDLQDKQESAHLSANLTAVQNLRSDMVAAYNARAKMVNRSIFMGKDVPESIEQQ